MKNRVIRSTAHAFTALALFLSKWSMTSAKTFSDLVDNVTGDFATSVIRLIFALSVVYFFWGVAQYTLYPDGESKDKGKQVMVWGIIGLTVMFTVYSLVRVVINTLLL